MTGEFALAVHAIIYMDHKKSICSSEILSKSINTNPARVRKVMSALKKAGIVSTKEGVDGGYIFVGEAAKVTLADILNAVGTKPVSTSWRPGKRDDECPVSRGVSVLIDEIFEMLNFACEDKLRELTILDMEKRIFPETDREAE